ncbi:hypothetical protein [Acidocella sp.]|uniref:hypothetical protein n=1 Tax=Acidocella sp. TaxID=50710 RepID=UPI003D0778D9
MVAVTASEVEPGLVVHLSPELLKSAGGCKIQVEPGKETQDDHYFLIVAVYEDETALATPLFSTKHGIRDRVLLVEAQKSGKEALWIGTSSYFFKWQFWRIPVHALELASAKDDSQPENRRRYAASDKTVLASVTKDISRLRQPWRDWNSN